MEPASETHMTPSQQEKLRTWNPNPQTYEVDPRWQQVDTYTTSHLHPAAATPSPAILEAALDRSKNAGLPKIEVSPIQGKYLMLQARMINSQRILEVGTLGGYSTIWLANANQDVKITTIEVDAEHAKVARENFEAAGVSERIDIRLGPALEILPQLLDELNSNERQAFDMVFIDADKPNSWNYFNIAVGLCRPGACIIVDNVVRRGFLADAEKAKTDPNIQGNRLLVEEVGKDSRVDAVVLQLVGGKNYDGLLVATVN